MLSSVVMVHAEVYHNSTGGGSVSANGTDIGGFKEKNQGYRIYVLEVIYDDSSEIKDEIIVSKVVDILNPDLGIEYNVEVMEQIDLDGDGITDLELPFTYPKKIGDLIIKGSGGGNESYLTI